MVKQILFFAFLLGIWGQATSACPEAPVASAAPRAAMEIAVSASEDLATAAGGERRCECPTGLQGVQPFVSESDKSFLAPYLGEGGAFLSPSNPNSVALAERSRSSSFIARPSGRPLYLFVSRLRQ